MRNIFLTAVKCLSVPRNRLNFNGKRLSDNVQDRIGIFQRERPAQAQTQQRDRSAERRCGNGLAWLSPHPAVLSEARMTPGGRSSRHIQRFHCAKLRRR